MENCECIFCELIDERSMYIIDENEHCIAFLDKYPVSEGHILISPKQHFEVFHNIENPLILKDLIDLMTRISVIVSNKYKTDYNIHQSNGKNADQSIQHVHFHVIPRTESDNVEISLPANSNIDLEHIYKFLTNKI